MEKTQLEKSHGLGGKIYNTPIEIGLRCLIILNENTRRSIDLERLMYIDFLALNTFDFGGPESIHPPLPNRGVQVYSRRSLIQKGVLILLSKQLIEIQSTALGFSYLINSAGKSFLKYFESQYFFSLVERVKWSTSYLSNYSTAEIEQILNQNFSTWGSEFLSNDN
jgi:hypothetical protein